MAAAGRTCSRLVARNATTSGTAGRSLHHVRRSLVGRTFFGIVMPCLLSAIGCRDAPRGNMDDLPENRLVVHRGPDLEDRLLESARVQVRHARTHFASVDPDPSRVTSIAQSDAALACLDSPDRCATYPPVVINALATRNTETGVGGLSVRALNFRRDTCELGMYCSPRPGIVITFRQKRTLIEKNECQYWGYDVSIEPATAAELETASDGNERTIEVPPEAPFPFPLEIIQQCCATVVDRSGRVGNCVPIRYVPIGTPSAITEPDPENPQRTRPSPSGDS